MAKVTPQTIVHDMDDNTRRSNEDLSKSYAGADANDEHVYYSLTPTEWLESDEAGLKDIETKDGRPLKDVFEEENLLNDKDFAGIR